MAGDFAGARTMLDAALAAYPGSPDVLDAMGALVQDMGDTLDAERWYRSALARAEAGNTLQRARILNNLATLYLETDQRSKLDDVGKEVELVPVEELETSSTDAATIFSTLAAIRRVHGDQVGASRMYERSIEQWKRTPNAGPMIGFVETSIANMDFEDGRYDEAVLLFRQAVDHMEATVGPNHPMLLRPLYGLAACECQAGDAAAAEPIARRAFEIAQKRLGAGHPLTAQMQLMQARVWRKLGRKRAASALEKEANSTLRDVAGRNFSGFTVDVHSLSKKR
jgi:tetratricopeptide (TPR) repeat protein